MNVQFCIQPEIYKLPEECRLNFEFHDEDMLFTKNGNKL